jgi:hypothetical protein
MEELRAKARMSNRSGSFFWLYPRVAQKRKLGLFKPSCFWQFS